MKILLLGSGGREHCIAHTLSKSNSVEKIYAAPGNPGIFEIAEFADINISEHKQVVDFCRTIGVDLVVVGPEQPLAEGITDSLIASEINVFGPSRKAAQLESSKAFAKEFMYKYNIPTAKYKSFSQSQAADAHKFIDSMNLPIVLKADGLAAGKGVIIAESYEEAHSNIDKMFEGLFADAGNTIVIEEFMQGEEASILAICDGNDYVTLASSQDHKRAFDNDLGPNTGGMGAYAPAPIVSDDVFQKFVNEILEPTINGMNQEGTPFIGCLYCGLMIYNGQPKVVEYNVRFGDPETQAVLPLFEGDFAELLLSASKGKIEKSHIKSVENACSCCVILASNGYPGSFEKGFTITGINEAKAMNAIVFHSGTKLVQGNLVNSGGRVLAVTSVAPNLVLAVENTYKAIEKINFQNKFYRKDIAKKALK